MPNFKLKGASHMIIIGEKINATRKEVAGALADKNADLIVKLAKSQAQNGATYLDINGGDPSKEVQNIEWLIDVVQDNSELPICIDSSNPQAIQAGLKKVKAKPIINSISLEKEKLAQTLPLVKENDCSVIALMMSDDGVPAGVDDRLKRADDLISLLTQSGKKEDEIFIDPCFLAIYSEANAGLDVLESIRQIRKRFPDVHISGGVSNSSFGMPERKWINLAYLLLAMGAGLDAAIIDPCVEGAKELILAAQVILKNDEMGMEYISEMK